MGERNMAGERKGTYMVKPKYLYDIYDAIEKDYMVKDALSCEVTEFIDMPHECISRYARTGSLYLGRYRLERKDIEDGKYREKVKEDIPEYLMNEFNAVVADLRWKCSPEKLSKITITKRYVEAGGTL
jgi:hypothetical protein